MLVSKGLNLAASQANQEIAHSIGGIKPNGISIIGRTKRPIGVNVSVACGTIRPNEEIDVAP
jgi:hypothetical protein